MNKIYFSKIRQSARIPTKIKENAGYDLYVDFVGLDLQIMEPGSIRMLPTGLACAFSSDYVMILKERGSIGSKGLALRCGVIDSGFRNEIFICVNNTSNKKIVLCNDVAYCDHYSEWEKYDFTVINIQSKALAQAILTPAMHLETEEISYEQLKTIKSVRMFGMLGSTDSNKTQG